MIVCPHCNEANTLSVLNGDTAVSCRNCGHAILPSICQDKSFTRKISDAPNGSSDVIIAESALDELPGEDKYTLEREIARGGMGAIYSVFEDGIHRNVAMKVMLSNCGPSGSARFIQEAQVTGQLEHPNIVPIHDLGMRNDGRPFFTMKMVRGRSLADVLSLLKRGETAAQREFSLAQLLTVLVNVCNAMAFAHSKGVIHRDLKPGNVMLGNFGEVLVMDWGLAKVCGATRESAKADVPQAGTSQAASEANGTAQSENAADAELASIVWSFRNASGADTLQGTIAGTPAYMSPEQARGEITAVDTLSDIYALGAILYEILTLSPPARGKTIRDILKSAAEGRIDAPENVSPERRIPKELSAIARKALAFEKKKRYPNAIAFREEIERYLHGESVLAHADTLLDRLVKFIRRNKTACQTAAAFLILLFAGAGFSVERIWSAKNDAVKELSKRLEIERQELERQKAVARKSNEANDRGKAALKRALADPTAVSEAALVEAQIEFRQALFLVRENPSAEEGLRAASLAHMTLAMQNKNWRQAWEKLEQARSAGLQPDHYEDRRQKLSDAEEANGKYIRAKVAALMDDARKVNRETPHEMAKSELISLRDPITIELLTRFASDDNANCRMLAIDSLAWMGDLRPVNAMLGNIEAKFGGVKNSLEVQEAAVRALCILSPQDDAVFNAVCLRVLRDPAGIDSVFYKRLEQYYRRYAAKMSKKPDNGKLQDLDARQLDALAARYLAAGQFELSLACCDEMLKRNPANAGAYFDRAGAKAAGGDLDGAILDMTECARLTPNHPDCYWNLGKFKTRKRDYAGAAKDFETGLKLNPKHAFMLAEFGDLKLKTGDYKGAVAVCTRAIELDPNNFYAYIRRGHANLNLKDLDAAAVDVERLLQLEPNGPAAYHLRSELRKAQGDLEGAMADLEHVLKCDPKYVIAYFRQGQIRRLQKKHSEAILLFDNAIQLDPKFAWGWFGRAEAKNDLGDSSAALADVNKAIELDPGFADAIVLRAAIVIASGNPDDAPREYEAALAADPLCEGAYKGLLEIYRSAKKWKQLHETYLRWIKAAPDDAEPLNAYAWDLLTSVSPEFKDFASALAFAQKAQALSQGKNHKVLDTLARAYFDNGMPAKAAEAEQTAVQLAPKNDAYRERLKQYGAALKGPD